MCLEEVQRISPIIKQVGKLMDICCEKFLSAQSMDEEVEWLIALENVKLFFANLGSDLEAVAPFSSSSADDAKTFQPQIRSIEDVKLEYTRLTMKYYQKPGLWNTKKVLKDENWIFPRHTQSAHTPLDPVGDDESPHSTQSTISASYASGKQPEAQSDSDKLPSPGSLELYLSSKALNGRAPAYQSSAPVFASQPVPSSESVEGALASSEFVWAPPAAQPQNSSQLSSSYGSGLTFSTISTPGRVETGCSLPTLNQTFPTTETNAAERRPSSSDHSYCYDPAPPHNHVEMPFSYGSCAYASQPWGYMKSPPSSSSCARAQPASASGNWVSCLSPTAVQTYNESSYYDTETQPTRPKSAPYKYYSMSSPVWNSFPVDRDLSLYHDWVNEVEDSNRRAQPDPEPLIFNGPVRTQPSLNRAQFEYAQLPRPAAVNRGTQTSPEPLPLYNWAQRQPASNTAQFTAPSSSLQPYPEVIPFDNVIHRQPALNKAQFGQTQPPRPAVSSRTIQPYLQPYLEQPSFHDWAPRQTTLDSAQFDMRQFPATYDNLNTLGAFNRGSESYPEQMARNTAYPLQPLRTAAAEPANANVNLLSLSSNDNPENPSLAYVYLVGVFPC